LCELKTIRKSLSLIFLLVAASLLSDAQPDRVVPNQLFFKRISTEQGLPQPSVNSILRDSRGFVWMATEDGLSRFDGTAFRTFRHDPADSTSLSHNVVHFIQEDDVTGNLWIGTVSGINYFDRSLEKFKVFKTGNPPGTVYTNAALDKKRGRLWLACTVAGLRYLDLSKQVVIDIKNPGLDNETVWNVKIDGDSLMVATLQGLKILNLQNEQVSTLYTSTPVRSVLVDRNNVWFGTEGNGLGQYDRTTKKITYYNQQNGGTNNNDIWSLAKDNDHNLWIGTDGGGLNVLMHGKKTSRLYMHSEFDERSLSYNTIRSIFVEPNGNVWLGTYNGGVSYHEATAIQFQLYHKEFFNENSLRNNAVSAFTEADDGTIWVGTDGGGLHYFKNGVVHRYELPQKLSNINVITSLKSDREGLWVGTFQNGLLYFDGRGGWKQFKHNVHDSTSIAANTVWSIQKDSLGYLWIGTNRGVNRFDPKTEVFHHIGHPLNGKISKLFKNFQAQTILISSDQTLWVGSYGFLMAYLPALDSVIEIKGEDGRGRSIPDLRVKTLLQDGDRIWIGTYGSGLCQYNTRTHAFHILDERDGLPDNIVLAIQKGEPGSLWLSTNKGLIHFNEADTIFTVFDSDYGVQGTTFNRNAALRTSNGVLFFGGTQGFNIFKPHAFQRNQNSLAIVFTDFSIFNKQVKPGSGILKQSITETQSLDLSHTDSRLITLQFSAFNFLSSDKIIYAYKLEGFNDDWQNMGKDHSVTFTNLDPATYKLIVRASFNGRLWGPEKSLTIIIQTPWWKSTLFRLAVLLFFLMSGYSLYRYRTYQLNQRKIELEHLVRLQGQEIKNQNDDLAAQNEELKAQNDEMAAQQQIITEQNLQLNEAKRNLQVINQSLEQVVDQRTGKLNETIHKLNKTIKELDAFVYSASHDLIAPLKSMMGLVTLIRMQNEHEEVGYYIDHIERSIKKLEDVILNMIQYSKNSSLDVNHEEINLYELVQESISDITFLPGIETMTFDIAFDKNETITSDRKRLKIILNNLIGNSVKYKDDRKDVNKVKITFEKSRTIWKLEIEDNGIGIDKHYLSRVFEMFFRATDRSKGSGLGLYIVKETVERLYGEIYVDSEKGLWTKFTLAIPHDNIYLRKK
jgi:ligand-binding sensor domain-containing protein/anti-sigma regulatory factor (Ser/Thr protein kinase)